MVTTTQPGPARVGVGSPATYYRSYRFKFGIVSHTPSLDHLIIDTGSSNTWMGVKRSYVKTNHCEDTQLSCKYRARTYTECADLVPRSTCLLATSGEEYYRHISCRQRHWVARRRSTQLFQRQHVFGVFYSEHDTGKHRVGLTTTLFTAAESIRSGWLEVATAFWCRCVPLSYVSFFLFFLHMAATFFIKSFSCDGLVFKHNSPLQRFVLFSKAFTSPSVLHALS